VRNDRDKRASRVAHYVKTYDTRALAAMLVAVEDRERRARRRVRKMATAIRQPPLIVTAEDSDSMPCGCGCGLTRGGHRGVA